MVSPLAEKIILIVVIAAAACAIMIVGAVGWNLALGSKVVQQTSAAVQVVSPTPAPVQQIPQVIQVTVSLITAGNGRYEVDGSGYTCYFADESAWSRIHTGATYLFTPTTMEGSAYDVKNTYTLVQDSPYQSNYPTNYQYYNGEYGYRNPNNPNSNTWLPGHLYYNNGYWWHYVNGLWTVINPDYNYQDNGRSSKQNNGFSGVRIQANT